jgi:hypothetical protein
MSNSKDLKKIVWLASYPKSGNTWFRAFLTCLSQPAGKVFDINDIFISTLASNRYSFDEAAGISSSDLTAAESDALRPAVYRLKAEESAEILYYKIHDAYRLFPDGQPLIPADVTHAVLYFIRNPLDIVISFAHHLAVPVDKAIDLLNNPEYSFCSGDDKLPNQLRQQIFSWSMHVNSWTVLSPMPAMVLRYEDMLSHSYRWFNKALRFIGLKKSKQEILDALDKSSFEKLRTQEQHYGFAEKNRKAALFFRKGIAGEWKEILTTLQVKRILDCHGETMEKFGYVP